MGNKIGSHLWFDKEAVEAANFYATVFENSKINSKSVLEDTPSGNVDLVSMEIEGQDFSLISAGSLFKFNPSISFLVACKSVEEVDKLWSKLAEGGRALMELGEYPFSKKYGWTADKFGVSWQIMYFEDRPITQKITPTLMFTKEVAGRANEAIEFYTSIFRNSEIGGKMLYEAGEEPDKEGTLKHGSFKLEWQEFAAMDSAREHDFRFNEAISFIVNCENQEEIDYFWGKLSAVPEAEQCGWLKDKYGVSWQIVPVQMGEIMGKGSPNQIAKVTEAFLKMKKFDIAKLQEVFDNG